MAAQITLIKIIPVLQKKKSVEKISSTLFSKHYKITLHYAFFVVLEEQHVFLDLSHAFFSFAVHSFLGVSFGFVSCALTFIPAEKRATAKIVIKFFIFLIFDFLMIQKYSFF